MNENSKIYVVLGVVVALILVIIGYNIYNEKQSEKIYNQFTENLNSSEEKIVFIGSSTCSWCQLFQPIFDYYTKKYEIEYYYINTQELVNKHFNKILDDLNVPSDDFGTPLVVFVKDGKVEQKINGYVDEREILDILQKRGFVTEDETDILNYLDLKGIKKVFERKEKSVVVVGKEFCSACIAFKPILLNISDNYKVEINYFNYDEIEDQEELFGFLTKFEIFQESWSTPLTLIVENGKILDTFSDYGKEDKYLSFLNKNNLIKE